MKRIIPKKRSKSRKFYRVNTINGDPGEQTVFGGLVPKFNEIYYWKGDWYPDRDPKTLKNRDRDPMIIMYERDDIYFQRQYVIELSDVTEMILENGQFTEKDKYQIG